MRLPRQSIAKRAEEIIARMGLPLTMEIVWAENAKSSIKSETKNSAEKEWQAKVGVSTRLKYTYSAYTPLKTRGYLNEIFRETTSYDASARRPPVSGSILAGTLI